MRAVIYPYKFGSRSAKVLANRLGGIRVRDVGRYRKRIGDIIIGWGATKLPTWGESNLNKTTAINFCSDKLSALSKMKETGVRTVEFTEDMSVAKQWVDGGEKVYARTLTRASEGRGIVIVRQGSDIPKARLYTKGIDSTVEYRVHVFGGLVIDYTKKHQLITNSNNEIKSHGNGWTFARNVQRRPSVESEAVKAVQSLGLDFGAVDIIINPKDKNRPYVLEVNSAPGMNEDSRTLNSYATAINNYINTLQ